MLSAASYLPGVGAPVPFDVNLQRPDQIVLDGMVHSTDYSIEYQSADVTLSRDSVIHITTAQFGTENFKVRQTPQAKGDGTFMQALLEKTS